MIAAGLVPALALVLLWGAVRHRFADGRTALLAAAVLWGLLVVGMTEALSLAGAVRPGPLLVAWLGVASFLAWLAWRRRGAGVRDPAAAAPLGWDERLLTLGVGALAVAVGVVAVMAPPNTYDSMTYHMSRVAHWAQAGGVAHYPTPIVRQLFQPPWAEFAILQSYVLTGGDRLANLVQWGSMLGALVGVYLVAQHLGGDRRARLLAVAVAAAIPGGVVQASGTKNDYVLAFWLTCLAVFTFELRRLPRGARVGGWTALAGGALGLALLTKATACLFAAPFVAWICWARVRRDGARAWRVLLGLALVAGAVNAGHLARNLERAGAPLGPVRDGDHAYVNASFGPRATLSVAARNAGLHLGTPWTAVNAVTDGAMRAAHRFMGLDVDDPATTWWGTHFQVSGPKRHEDMLSNGLHLALVVAAVLALTARTELRTPDRLAYAAALVAGFLLFCAVLRWQPWHSRLQLPLFVLWAPVIGIALRRWPRVGGLVVVGLVAVAVVAVLANEPRPLTRVLGEPREALYFRAQPALREPYTDAVRVLAERGCARIGLVLGGDDWEYPLWVLARDAIPGVRLEHMVDASAPGGPGQDAQGLAAEAPCGIIARRPAGVAETGQGPRYRRVLAGPVVTVDVAEGPGPARPAR